MRAVTYARRSMEHQDGSVERQVQLAGEFIAAKGWRLVETYRDDQGHAGRKEFKNRPGFLRMLADAAERRFDIVVCRDLSRLGGDTSRTMRAIEDLREDGVAVWYYVDGTEQRVDNYADKMMLAIKSGMAEGERDAISSRTREALRMKAQQALCVGGRCYGYDLVPILNGSVKVRTEYAISKVEAPVVREIFERYARGEGLKGISKELNSRGVAAPRTGLGQWGPTTIRPMLQRERYRGVISWGSKHKTYKRGTKVRVTVEPCVVEEVPSLRIVSDELWAEVEERFERQRRIGSGRKGRAAPTYHLLSGLLRCGCCGGAVSVETTRWGSEQVKVYLCKARRHKGKTACENDVQRPVDEVDAALIAWVQEHVLTETVIANAMQEVRRRLRERAKAAGPELAAASKQAAKLKAEIAKLGEALLATEDKPAVILKMIADRERQLAEVEARVEAARMAPDAIDMETRRLEKQAKEKLGDLRALLTGSPQEGRAALESLLDGPLVVTPVRDQDGERSVRRFQLVGRTVLGGLPVTLRTEKSPLRRTSEADNRGRPRRDSNPC